jgi:hypothetical protein
MEGKEWLATDGSSDVEELKMRYKFCPTAKSLDRVALRWMPASLTAFLPKLSFLIE